MNRKIPFHELGALLAANCNITSEEAEEFIKNFFDLITLALTEGETVKIKGVGTFTSSGNASNPVDFTPDAEIADTINAPFALFEPETLSDTLSDDDLAAISAPTVIDDNESELTASPESTASNDIEDVTVAVSDGIKDGTDDIGDTCETHETHEMPETVDNSGTVEEATESVEKVEAEAKPKDTNVTKSDKVQVAIKPTVTYPEVKASAPSLEEEPEEYYSEPNAHRSGPGFGWGFVIGMLVGLAVGACGVYFAIDYIFPTMPVTTVQQEPSDEDAESLEEILSEAVPATEPVAPIDSAITQVQPATTVPVTTEPKTEPQQEKPATQATVKDTVRPGYLLNDMAKKHYGNKCFWVYIYEENKAKIANPNRVSPGLVLVIPPAEKYGIDASNKSSINAANGKAGKILSKYPR